MGGGLRPERELGGKASTKPHPWKNMDGKPNGLELGSPMPGGAATDVALWRATPGDTEVIVTPPQVQPQQE